MPRFRVLIQGECADPAADWFGFYATRDHEADSEADAESLAMNALKATWTTGGGLRLARTVACWRPKPWHRQMISGCTFYKDGEEARQEALQIEASAGNAPRNLDLNRS